MKIEKRVKLLIKELKVSLSDLETESKIPKQNWSASMNGRQRMNSDHIEFISEKFEEYAFWIMTGKSTYGKCPTNRNAFEHFEKLGMEFSARAAECQYLVSFSDANIEDSESLTPRGKHELQKSIYNELMTTKMPQVLEANTDSEPEQILQINQFFRELAISEIERLSRKFDVSTAAYKNTQRFFSVFILADASDNLLK